MEKIKEISILYYSRKDVQQSILQFSQNRETVPRYMEGFGKRPDSLQYESDIIEYAKKGATSFHCSQELWNDPLEISTELTPEQLSNIRTGWDLILDIDSKYMDFSKIAAELLTKALEFHGIKNFNCKFSGSKGMHIIVPWKAFPEEINNLKTKDMFPDWPRLITQYLTELIRPELINKVSNLGVIQHPYIKDFDAPKQVMPDLVLVSPRHLFRAPNSLHEKTALASIIIDKDKISSFSPQDANPLKIKPQNFLPEPKPNEARELLIQALDWHKTKQEEKKTNTQYKEFKIDKGKILLPPCIKKILEGISDGKKRALFVLINYYRYLDFERREIEELIEKWNKKNKPPLKDGYITAQIEWTFRQKKLLPPNCDKDHYKGIGVCNPDDLCKIIKNPLNYTIKSSFRKNGRKKTD